MLKGLLFTLLFTLSFILHSTNIAHVTEAHAQDKDLNIALMKAAKNGNVEEVITITFLDEKGWLRR